MIAAIAIRTRAQLVTLNLADFRPLARHGLMLA
jgi:predicted nucleic acid-binding protein